MKTTKFLAIIAFISFVSCVNKPHDDVGKPDISTFYPYNPADTIDNPYYHNLLMVDSTRVFYKEIRDSHPISNSNEYSKKYEDSLYAAEAKIWLSIMDMASKKKWEECLRLYEKNHVPLYYVLENSLVMFNADYHVFSEIMYDYYPETEADAINLKLFEEDFWITSYAMYSDDDYFPDHYEELTRFLSQLYAKLGKRGKALEMAEIYKDVLSDLYDKRDVEHLYLNHMSELYLKLKDYDNALKNMYSLRNCVIKNFDDESLKAYCLYQIDDIINETKQNKNRADSGQATTPHSLGEE